MQGWGEALTWPAVIERAPAAPGPKHGLVSLAGGRQAHPPRKRLSPLLDPLTAATFRVQPPEHPGRACRAGSRSLHAHVPTTHSTEEKAEAQEEVSGPLSSRAPAGSSWPGRRQAAGPSLPLSPQPSRPMPAWVALLLVWAAAEASPRLPGRVRLPRAGHHGAAGGLPRPRARRRLALPAPTRQLLLTNNSRRSVPRRLRPPAAAAGPGPGAQPVALRLRPRLPAPLAGGPRARAAAAACCAGPAQRRGPRARPAQRLGAGRLRLEPAASPGPARGPGGMRRWWSWPRWAWLSWGACCAPSRSPGPVASSSEETCRQPALMQLGGELS